RLGLAELGHPGDPRDLGNDVLTTGDAQVDRIARGEAQLVDGVDVTRVGDRDLQAVAGQRDRDGDSALERPDGDAVGQLGRYGGTGDVDVGQAVAPGECHADTFCRGDALRLERLRERAGARFPSCRCEPVAADELGDGYELGHQVGDGAET